MGECEDHNVRAVAKPLIGLIATIFNTGLMVQSSVIVPRTCLRGSEAGAWHN